MCKSGLEGCCRPPDVSPIIIANQKSIMRSIKTLYEAIQEQQETLAELLSKAEENEANIDTLLKYAKVNQAQNKKIIKLLEQ